MYLITAYFDDESTYILQKHINAIAKASNNTYMTDNKVPPHLTICQAEAPNVDVLCDGFKAFAEGLKSEEVTLASIGMLFPYVVYSAPVPNEYLLSMSKKANEIISAIPDVSVNKYYRTDSFLPHVTLAKKLDEEQMLRAISSMRSSFVPINANIVRVGLSKVNPHFDVDEVELK